MKIIKLLSVAGALFLALGIKAQTFINFAYTVGPGSTVTFSNTSTSSMTTAATTFTCTWDTGNGMTYTTSALSQTISTTYASNGSFPVTLTVSFSNPGFDYAITQDVVFFNPACPLSVSASATGGGSLSPAVSFQGTSTGSLSTTTYAWDFGDGTSGSGANPSHTYTGNGLYGYTVTATNNATCTSFVALAPTYSYTGPTNICSYTPAIITSASPNGVINFTVTGVGSANTFWEFGDYTYSYAYSNPVGNIFSHTYFNGTHTPTLSTNNGSSCQITLSGPAITVTDNACYANAAFTYTAGSGGAVQFSSSPPAGGNIAYLWKFGDGVISYLANPSHTYTSAGNYPVRLISYDATYSVNPYDTSYFYLPCHDDNITNLNITGIPCIANSSFSVQPAGIPHYYTIIPDYMYNVSAAVWNWGDGTTSNQLYSYHNYAAPGNYNICLTVTTSCGGTSTTCLNQYLAKGENAYSDMVYVNVDAPAMTTGISEAISEAIALSLFPNPANGLLNIGLAKATDVKHLEVFDLLGNSVYLNAAPQEEEKTKIDVSALNNGIYFIKIKLPNGTATSKFIIAH